MTTMQTGSILVAADDGAPPKEEKKKDDSPEAKMNRRFPQKVVVGTLIGLPVIDDNNKVFGEIRQVVRTPDQKVRLIVSFGRWFGRLVSVPIEVVAIVGKQVASLDMKPEDYDKAPTWKEGTDQRIPDADTIRIALARR